MRVTRTLRAATVNLVSAATAHTGDAVLYAVLSLHTAVTVNAYLVGRGVAEAARKRWGSAFGRLAAKAHRATGHAFAVLTEVTTTGRRARTFAYVGNDVRHLDTAFDHYADKLFADA